MNVFKKSKNAYEMWNIIGSFGSLAGEVTASNNTFYAKNGTVSIVSEIKKSDNGIFERTGKLKNISKEKIVINTLSSKFSFDGGEYEIYSQYNGWQNESVGQWQPLVTTVSARSLSVRNASSAAPFMVLWSNQLNRGIAFHLQAYSSWEMKISRLYEGSGEASFIEAEFGVMSEGLVLELAPGEEVELPEIIYYDVLNKTDMDCWKLHKYLNEKYPRKGMPVIYNTWLYKFDRFTYSSILQQIDKAEELGVEYFVIDAGWFGNGEDWWSTRGDWNENQTFGFCGRTKEIAVEIRKRGMKFGFWLEPECASSTSETAMKHPEYFLKGDSYFIDFSNPEALEYIYNKTCELIDGFGAEFIKFDFNADLNFDKSQYSFIKYCNGHKKYIQMLKSKYPSLYIENCAAGGLRMGIRDGAVYDSFWPSDNQSLYFGLEIFKDSILRMPPQWLEAWIAITLLPKLTPLYGSSVYSDKIIACNNADWSDVSGVDQSFLIGFLTGRPIGLSFDLTSLTRDVFDELKRFIADFKCNRDFWQKSMCHILTDTDSMLVLEFRNDDFSRAEIVVFSKKIMQDNICVYPLLNEEYNYKLSEDSVKTGREILEEGINFPVNHCYTAQFLSINKI